MTAADTNRAIDAVWRIESSKLIAALARMVRDLGLAEELAQDALVAALETWPATGVPDNPAAWLMQTAKNRGIDRLRRLKLAARKEDEAAREIEAQLEAAMPDLEAALDDDIGDERLGLIFTACHPVLSADARAALTLRLLGGLTTEEIARAFLVPEPTMAQRIVRAKRTLTDARVSFGVPRGEERGARLASVLEVIYLIFNEGYSATSGENWIRPTLCEEALRLGRALAGLAPQEPEVHGLLSLMEIQASRLKARVDAKGEPILLLDQDRTRWDQLLIRRGLTGLERAEETARAAGMEPGPYTLQAALATCHARARKAEDTDWARIVGIYSTLAERMPSPVVELNRAVALGMLMGPAAGLEIVDALKDEPTLKNYHLLPSVRGDFLKKLGRREEARAEFERAAAMTENEREKKLLLDRAKACG
jgi:RNA polymerase sigma factor (sigma-70 family)